MLSPATIVWLRRVLTCLFLCSLPRLQIYLSDEFEYPLDPTYDAYIEGIKQSQYQQHEQKHQQRVAVLIDNTRKDLVQRLEQQHHQHQQEQEPQGQNIDSDGASGGAFLLPHFVALRYAPLVYLDKEEKWFPTDTSTFLDNVVPLNAAGEIINPAETGTGLNGAITFPSLVNLPRDTYLSSTQDITDLPDPSWLNNADGRPDDFTGKSAAPVEIIVVPKGDSDGTAITDVFYFFFYAYNRGSEVITSRFGDHLGDWEHIMIRFKDSIPQTIYLSQHYKGTAYAWEAINKTPEGVPIIYARYGSHGSFASAGTWMFDTFHTVKTSVGPAWDTAQNYRSYLFNTTDDSFRQLDASSPFQCSSSSLNGADGPHNLKDGRTTCDGTAWLYFKGQWGDQRYSDSDSRQDCLLGHCRYESGPRGPYDKNLGRKAVCQIEENCEIRRTL